MKLWNVTRGKKRNTGAAIALIPLIVKFIAKIFKFDFYDDATFNGILDATLAIGTAIYSIGITDYVCYKILPITIQVERLISIFNKWAKKLKPNK
jgi:hypothetical protein